MGIFSKGKGKPVKFDYYVLIHSLSPWPNQYKQLVVTWQRGSGRKGQTSAVGPSPEQPGRSWGTYQFEESLHVPCTLIQVRFELQ